VAQIEQLNIRDWEVLRISGEGVSLDIVPALGGTVTALRRLPDGASLLWSTPWGLRHRGARPLPGSSEALMIDSYPGGWQTLFPNGGETAVVQGAEWAHDGEARLTWLDWETQDDAVVLRGRLVRSPFQLTKTFTVTGDTVTLEERIRNDGGEAMETMWGAQLTFGGDLVGLGTTISTSASTVHPDPRHSIGTSYDDVMPWPRSHGPSSVVNLSRLPGPQAAETRLSYLDDFSSYALTVHSPDRSLGVDVEWDEIWPFVWYALEAGGRSGFPWYSAGYFLALTPATSWPGHGLHEVRRTSGTTLWVQPGEELTSRLRLRVHPGAGGD
jgi:galactose mutarotase-like enzyme